MDNRKAINTIDAVLNALIVTHWFVMTSLDTKEIRFNVLVVYACKICAEEFQFGSSAQAFQQKPHQISPQIALMLF